jgi:hypothetical protein
LGALIGSGYVDLRQDLVAEASARFASVLAERPNDIDALVGSGLAAWRLGQLDEVASRFRRVEALDPGNSMALEYLAQLPAGVGAAPERAPLILPDTLVLAARTSGNHFQVPTGSRG